MKKIIKLIKSRFTMKCIGGAFTDSCSGEHVNYYRDCYGVEFMATNNFPLCFRVERRPSENNNK